MGYNSREDNPLQLVEEKKEESGCCSSSGESHHNEELLQRRCQENDKQQNDAEAAVADAPCFNPEDGHETAAGNEMQQDENNVEDQSQAVALQVQAVAQQLHQNQQPASSSLLQLQQQLQSSPNNSSNNNTNTPTTTATTLEQQIQQAVAAQQLLEQQAAVVEAVAVQQQLQQHQHQIQLVGSLNSLQIGQQLASFGPANAVAVLAQQQAVLAQHQAAAQAAALPIIGAAGVVPTTATAASFAPPGSLFATTLQQQPATTAVVAPGNNNPLLAAAVASSSDPTIVAAASAVTNSPSTATAAAQGIVPSASIAAGGMVVPSPHHHHHHHHHLLSPQLTIPHYIPPIPPTWGSQTPALSVQDRPLVPPIYNGINPNYPGAQLLHAHPPIFCIDNFLSPAECDFLIDNANDAFGPAPVVGKGSGEVSPSRTSSTCYLAREDLPEYLRKVSLLTGKPVEHCELPQVGRYMPSQQYLQHFDAFDLSNDDGRRFAVNGGQRTVTVLVYLNNVPRGGATAFPNLNIEVQPRRGMALVFFPSTLDGLLDKMALHAALPAVDVKYVSQVWIRQSNYEGRPSKRLREPMVAGMQERREARERLLIGQFAAGNHHGVHPPPPHLHHHQVQAAAHAHAARQVQAAQQHAHQQAQAQLHQAQQVAQQQQQQHLQQQGYQPMGN